MKGSSSTLGLLKIQKSCEKIQNFGKRRDATGNAEQPDDEKSLQDIKHTLDAVQLEYNEAKHVLMRWFNADG